MTIHPTVRTLIAEIDVFRAKTGMSITAFGMDSLGDPKFIGDLHRGRTPGLATIDKVRAFMQAHNRRAEETAA